MNQHPGPRAPSAKTTIMRAASGIAAPERHGGNGAALSHTGRTPSDRWRRTLGGAAGVAWLALLCALLLPAVAHAQNQLPQGFVEFEERPTVGVLADFTLRHIRDPDGPGFRDLTYEWRVTAGTASPITTDPRYTPNAADVGEKLSVNVRYTDDGGTRETVYGKVERIGYPTDETTQCTDDGYTPCRMEPGEEKAGDIWPIGDTDRWMVRLYGGRTYTITVAPHADQPRLVDPKFRLLNPQGSVVASNDEGVPGTHAARITYTVPSHVFGTHGIDVSSSTTVTPQDREGIYTVSVTEHNGAATGRPTISVSVWDTGTKPPPPDVGTRLGSSVSAVRDINGVPPHPERDFDYQWIRVDGERETEIDSATGRGYKPVRADAGKRLKVRASFTDRAGYRESVESHATTVIVNNDVALTSLVVKGIAGATTSTAKTLQPAFSGPTTAWKPYRYEARIETHETRVSVEAIVRDITGASVSFVNGRGQPLADADPATPATWEYDLEPGRTPVSILVTAENGRKKVYGLFVTRAGAFDDCADTVAGGCAMQRIPGTRTGSIEWAGDTDNVVGHSRYRQDLPDRRQGGGRPRRRQRRHAERPARRTLRAVL